MPEISRAARVCCLCTLDLLDQEAVWNQIACVETSNQLLVLGMHLEASIHITSPNSAPILAATVYGVPVMLYDNFTEICDKAFADGKKNIY